MDIKTAIQYVKSYRNNGKRCYVHSENRGRHEFQTKIGHIYFACHNQRNTWGMSKTKFCAYLNYKDSGKPVPSKLFNELLEN